MLLQDATEDEKSFAPADGKRNDSVLLFTQDTISARAEITQIGGRVTHQFTPNVFVSQLPRTFDLGALGFSSTNMPTELDDISTLMVQSWTETSNEVPQQSFSAVATETDALARQLPWDAPGHQPPGTIDAQEAGTVLAAEQNLGGPTSSVLVGDVAVGVIMVSGPPSSGLEFSLEEKKIMVGQVMEGLDFLATSEPAAQVTVSYDIREITVEVPPVSDPGPSHEAYEAVWRNPAMEKMGFAGSVAGVSHYVQQLREDKKSRSAYVGFFTKYPLRHFAYARVGGPRVVMHYTNDGWGPDQIGKVFAHETAHIFGCYEVPDSNSAGCSSEHMPCLMNSNTYSLCPLSRGQLGWSLKQEETSQDGLIPWKLKPYGPKWSNADGWGHACHYSTIQSVMVGNALYLIGRSPHGIVMQRWNGRGWNEMATGPWWSDRTGWDKPRYYSTIQSVAIGLHIYLIGRGPEGLFLHKYNVSTDLWEDPSMICVPTWSDKNRWHLPQFYSTIQAVVADNQLFVIARNPRVNGRIVLLQFDAESNAWQHKRDGPEWSDETGWGKPQYYSTIQAVAMDKDIYLIGRSMHGIQLHKYDISTDVWTDHSQGSPPWSDKAGWDHPQYYSTIQAVSTGNTLYLSARAMIGIVMYEFKNEEWTTQPLFGPRWSNLEGWGQPEYYSTIQSVALGEDLYMVARGKIGLWTYEFSGGHWSQTALPGSVPFSNHFGWNRPEYYSTIQLDVEEENAILCVARNKFTVLLYKLVVKDS